MSDISKSDLSLDQIMERIHREAERLESTSSRQPTPEFPYRKRPSMPQKQVYHVTDFSPFHDREFLNVAYGTLLGRQPDPAADVFLDSLRNGTMTRTEILACLRFSPEGCGKKVKIKGILPCYLLKRLSGIPLLGRIARFLIFLGDVPALVRDLRALPGIVSRDRELADLRHRQVESLMDSFRELFSQLEEQKVEKEERVYLARRVARQERALAALQASQKEENEGSIPLHAVGGEDSFGGAREHAAFLDGFYADLEEVFRGTREQIIERQRVYLPFIERVGAGLLHTPVLDLGCGRGEWLQLLIEHERTAHGVDLNPFMLDACRELGLPVSQKDALTALRELPSQSQGAVSAFHLVEHLELKTLLDLVDEVLRVLKPGGLFILETPNPANIMVGSYNFYFDPTHGNPLPAPLLKFVLEHRGFHRVEPWGITRQSGCDYELTPLVPGADDFNGILCLPHDYALTAQKLVEGNSNQEVSS